MMMAVSGGIYNDYFIYSGLRCFVSNGRVVYIISQAGLLPAAGAWVGKYSLDGNATARLNQS